MPKRTHAEQLDLFNIANPTCVIDGEQLTGRQSKFCSKRCANQAAYEGQKASGYRQGAGAAVRKAWMDANRKRLEERATEHRVCSRCGRDYTTRFRPQRFCSKACWGAAKHEAQPPKEPKPPYIPPPPGPVRQALINRDWPALIDALRDRTTSTDGGCWEWVQRLDQSGYGVVRTTGGARKRKDQSAHRVMAMAIVGGDVPSHLMVHHKCANRKCINPDHLQVVQPHENTAEMLERNYYVRRIAELEAALAAALPAGHG